MSTLLVSRWMVLWESALHCHPLRAIQHFPKMLSLMPHSEHEDYQVSAPHTCTTYATTHALLGFFIFYHSRSSRMIFWQVDESGSPFNTLSWYLSCRRVSSIDQIEELFIVMVYCMYSEHVTLSTLSLVSLFLTATYLSKAQYSLFVLKVPLNPSQSIDQHLIMNRLILLPSIKEFRMLLRIFILCRRYRGPR